MTYETKRYKAAFARSLQISLSWAESTQFFVLILRYLRSILIDSSHLRQDLPKYLYPVGLAAEILKELLLSSVWLYGLPILII